MYNKFHGIMINKVLLLLLHYYYYQRTIDTDNFITPNTIPRIGNSSKKYRLDKVLYNIQTKFEYT